MRFPKKQNSVPLPWQKGQGVALSDTFAPVPTFSPKRKPVRRPIAFISESI